MRRIDSSKIVPYEDATRPNMPYVFVDGLNNDVQVQEIEEEKHSPHDLTIIKDPQVYSNLGYAVRHPDEEKITFVDNGRAIKKIKFNNLLARLDHPAKETMKNVSLIVVVEYREDKSNRVVTYYDKPEGAIW
ncbi:hypothetical protein IJG90_03685 [Candidatus Saccharibacteria bacterium]|nr:hypothetical protein [Candidatus Saccharibacteria bacterium]